jgi:hypothetical protein
MVMTIDNRTLFGSKELRRDVARTEHEQQRAEGQRNHSCHVFLPIQTATLILFG